MTKAIDCANCTIEQNKTDNMNFFIIYFNDLEKYEKLIFMNGLPLSIFLFKLDGTENYTMNFGDKISFFFSNLRIDNLLYPDIRLKFDLKYKQEISEKLKDYDAKILKNSEYFLITPKNPSEIDKLNDGIKGLLNNKQLRKKYLTFLLLGIIEILQNYRNKY